MQIPFSSNSPSAIHWYLGVFPSLLKLHFFDLQPASNTNSELFYIEKSDWKLRYKILSKKVLCKNLDSFLIHLKRIDNNLCLCKFFSHVFIDEGRQSQHSLGSLIVNTRIWRFEEFQFGIFQFKFESEAINLVPFYKIRKIS